MDGRFNKILTIGYSGVIYPNCPFFKMIRIPIKSGIMIILLTISIAFYFMYLSPILYNDSLAYDVVLGEYTEGINIPEGVEIKLLKGEPKMPIRDYHYGNVYWQGIYDPVRNVIYLNLNGSDLNETRKTLRHELLHWKYIHNLTKEEKKRIKGMWETRCGSPSEFYARIKNKELIITD